MRNNDVLGIIFANLNESAMPELTATRTMASVPVGGKYRLIDFYLSNFTNSGINNVGVISNKNFMSLMDHLGSGKAWDLSRKRSGLAILTPYDGKDNSNEVEMLYNIHGYLESCKENYVLLTSANAVTNIDYDDMFDFHSANNADITVVYKNTRVPEGIKRPMIVDADENGKINDIYITPEAEGVKNICFGTVLVSKALLLTVIKQALSVNETNIKKVIRQAVLEYNAYAFENKGYFAPITTMKEYFYFNMDLMNPEVRKELFNKERPIYTKVRDDTPCQYGLDCSITNSLVSQGCVIDGTVENCVLSKGVRIGKGSVVKNCIIMQDTKIGDNVNLNYVIIDKDVVVNNNRDLMGYESYPIFITKKSIV